MSVQLNQNTPLSTHEGNFFDLINKKPINQWFGCQVNNESQNFPTSADSFGHNVSTTLSTSTDDSEAASFEDSKSDSLKFSESSKTATNSLSTDEYITQIVYSDKNWGRTPIDQSTPWERPPDMPEIKPVSSGNPETDLKITGAYHWDDKLKKEIKNAENQRNIRNKHQNFYPNIVQNAYKRPTNNFQNAAPFNTKKFPTLPMPMPQFHPNALMHPQINAAQNQFHLNQNHTFQNCEAAQHLCCPNFNTSGQQNLGQLPIENLQFFDNSAQQLQNKLKSLNVSLNHQNQLNQSQSFLPADQLVRNCVHHNGVPHSLMNGCNLDGQANCNNPMINYNFNPQNCFHKNLPKNLQSQQVRSHAQNLEKFNKTSKSNVPSQISNNCNTHAYSTHCNENFNQNNCLSKTKFHKNCNSQNAIGNSYKPPVLQPKFQNSGLVGQQFLPNNCYSRPASERSAPEMCKHETQEDLNLFQQLSQNSYSNQGPNELIFERVSIPYQPSFDNHLTKTSTQITPPSINILRDSIWSQKMDY